MRLTVLLVLLAAPWAAAQGRFQEGFLLTTTLDTVRGFIRFPSKASAPMPCLFRPDKKAEAREVFPGNVHGFCTSNGAYYFSRTIGNSSDVFLEVLVKGYMNLFKFGGIYFIEKGDSVFFELSDDWEVMTPDGQRQQQRSHNYARMLGLLMADCPEIGYKAATIPLRDKPLVSLVTTYNLCRGSANNLFRVKVRAK